MVFAPCRTIFMWASSESTHANWTQCPFAHVNGKDGPRMSKAFLHFTSEAAVVPWAEAAAEAVVPWQAETVPRSTGRPDSAPAAPPGQLLRTRPANRQYRLRVAGRTPACWTSPSLNSGPALKVWQELTSQRFEQALYADPGAWPTFQPSRARSANMFYGLEFSLPHALTHDSLLRDKQE